MKEFYADEKTLKLVHLNDDFLEERQDDVAAPLRRHRVVKLEVRTRHRLGRVSEEQGPLQSVLRDQDLDGVLSDEQDVAGLVTNLDQKETFWILSSTHTTLLSL